MATLDGRFGILESFTSARFTDATSNSGGCTAVWPEARTAANMTQLATTNVDLIRSLSPLNSFSYLCVKEITTRQSHQITAIVIGLFCKN
jgi:hypothetical protein